MIYIAMNNLQYGFNDQGETTEITVSYNTYNEGERFNAQVILTSDYVQSANGNLTLDKMNKEQSDNFARRKLREWINIAEPQEPEENQTEENSSEEESTN